MPVPDLFRQPVRDLPLQDVQDDDEHQDDPDGNLKREVAAVVEVIVAQWCSKCLRVGRSWV